MKFWDASAIVPLCLDEPWTPLLTQVLVEDRLMLSLSLLKTPMNGYMNSMEVTCVS